MNTEKGVVLAIANRKGGVGKSTIATMLAHSFAVWGEMSVLVVDVDAQANASLILVGGDNWVRARGRNRTLADYIFDFFPTRPITPDEYILPEAGDVAALAGDDAPALHLLPGSIEIEDREHEILHRLAQQNSDLYQVEGAVTGRIKTLLHALSKGFDLVIIDCPPGISFSTRAALDVADKIVVPFRPDYVSLFAVDRVARQIEHALAPKQLADIAMDKRRYVTLADLYRGNAVHDRLVDEIAAYHPILATRIPQLQPIANAFDWDAGRKQISRKYGSAISHVQALYDELLPLVQGAGGTGGIATEAAG